MSGAETVLIVDDEPMLRMNLRAFLEDLGYHVQEAGTGLEALESCRAQPPDLILLDISMPGMDGLEACRALKADPATSDIPVLFLSALLSVEDKVRAFRVGGEDYLTKPYHFEEVEARIGTHLELRRQRRRLREQNASLLRMERLRDAFTHMMAHDLRSPLSAISGSMDLLELELGGRGGGDKHIERVRRTVALLVARIGQMLDVSRLESGQMPLKACPMDLVATVRQAVENLQGLAGTRRVHLASPEAVPLEADPELLGRVVENLLGNALKYAPPDSTIDLRLSPGSDGVLVQVGDQGPGLTEAQQEGIFEKYRQATPEDRRLGTGLGLAFCRLAVEAHGGRIGCESRPGEGATFWFSIPRHAGLP